MKIRTDIKPHQLTVDPEFRDLIRPLDEQENMALISSLEQSGLLSPILFWVDETGKKIVVDGHNRLSLWKEYDGFKGYREEDYEFITQEMELRNRYCALSFIIDHQLGRRNLGKDEITELLGRLHSSRKKEVSNPEGKNQHKEVGVQNDPQPKKERTAEIIAKEHNVSPATVKRAAKIVQKMDEIKAKEPELPKKEIFQKAKEEIKQKQAEKKQEKPEPTLEERFQPAWNAFVAKFPVSEHQELRKHIENKLKGSAL